MFMSDAPGSSSADFSPGAGFSPANLLQTPESFCHCSGGTLQQTLCFAGLLHSAQAPSPLIHLNPWPAVIRLSCFTPQLLAPYENKHPRKTTACSAQQRSGSQQEGGAHTCPC
jgi:hypothetical protein